MATSSDSSATSYREVYFGNEPTPFLTMTYSPDTRVITGRWIGHLTAEHIRLGAQAAIKFTVETPAARAGLTDGSGITGDWLDVLPWVLYDLLPRVARTNLRALAFIPSADPSTWLGGYAIRALNLLPVKVTASETEARAWIAQKLNQKGT